ncbi:MAG: DUF6273 domain-containing protein [Propionibacteriaceae bacterium]|nr:DUF6273 domain-containing protein [Propionibacteriaceae bacterium]
MSSPPLSLPTLFDVTPGGSNKHVYGQLIDSLDRLVPFVGAGLTCDAGFPLWPKAVRTLMDAIPFDCDGDKKISKAIEGGALDSAAELLYAAVEPDAFVNALREVFGRTADPAVVKRLPVALLPQAFPTGPVVTTNFDTVLENTVEFDRVIRGPVQFKADAGTLIRKSPRWLFKWHGCVTVPHEVVFTASQYRHQYWKNNGSQPVRFLKQLFRVYPMLFLGCSLLADRTIEVLIAIAKQYDLPHFALVEQDSDPEEYAEHGRLLSRAGIRALWYPRGEHDYVRVLLDAIIKERDSSDGARPRARFYWPVFAELRAIPRDRLMVLQAETPEYKAVVGGLAEYDLHKNPGQPLVPKAVVGDLAERDLEDSPGRRLVSEDTAILAALAGYDLHKNPGQALAAKAVVGDLVESDLHDNPGQLLVTADKAILADLAEWAADGAAEPIFALFGDYGMGKTVTCQAFAEAQLARLAEDRSARVPLYFDLRHVTDLTPLPTADDVMRQCLEGAPNREGQVTPDDFRRWVGEGGIVIWDGLDEVLVKLQDDKRKELTKRLLSVLDREAGAAGREPRVVITARTQFFPSSREMLDQPVLAARPFRARQLLPLSDDQILAYFAAALPQGDVHRVEKMIQSVHDLAGLTRRPFTLDLVVRALPEIEALQDQGKPVLGATLYREFARKWLANDVGRKRLYANHKFDLARELAAELWRQGKTELPVSKLQEWVARWGPEQSYWDAVYGPQIDKDPQAWQDKLDADLRTATLLSRVDLTETEGAFGFAHTSLQEFFLSEYLLQALKHNAPARWSMRTPSNETLDFLGQSLTEADGRRELATMARWFQGDDQAVNTIVLNYRWRASRGGLRQVSLPVRLVPRGATSETILTGEKVLLGGNVWRVLETSEQEGTALLLSENLVAYRAYHDEFTDIVWSRCSLRKWLNGEFYQSLPAEFAALIVETENDNPDTPRFGTPGGPNTWDKVFLLKRSDVDQFFSSDDASKVVFRHDGAPWWWWLRSPGDSRGYAMRTDFDGYVYVSGRVAGAAGGVRPAVKIRIPRS